MSEADAGVDAIRAPCPEAADYLDMLAAERGASGNTLAAYRRDLNGYVRWLEGRGIADVAEVTADVAAAFIAERAAALPAPAASSLARLQSAVRGWHRFLTREGIAGVDPTVRMRPPKTAQRLPKALTIEQVERLLAAPAADEPLGIRDRALLELL